jgi:ribosomal protein S18 acetylase RimI-like enzyme
MNSQEMTLQYAFSRLPFEDVYSFLLETEKDFPVPLSESLDLETYARKLATFSEFSLCYYEGKLIGMISCYTNYPPVGYVSNICVKKEFRGKGVFSELFVILLANAKEKGIKTIRLEVDMKNDKALGVYHHIGFEVAETRTEKGKFLLEYRL